MRKTGCVIYWTRAGFLAPPMDWKLEPMTMPVSDVDRAKAFYVERAGFVADHDHVGLHRISPCCARVRPKPAPFEQAVAP
jgi:hypothetical protein